ncbi:hypothetical protein C8R47DRAFT_1177743 [Mycena vitilis]|nr:hypothetical protein C8R47DRAFT_1177743 [Mycena vitilis]
MPGHVRFSSTNRFHSPPPPLVNSSFSSEPSSLGPLTPPPHHNARLPGPTPFAPKYHRSSKGRVHNLIALSNAPLLDYDVSLPPSSLSSSYAGVSAAGLAESAVYPPQHTLTLITPHLPWAIVVPATNGRFVAVSDVLHSLYSALRVNATAAEFHALGTHKLMQQAGAAYRARYERLRGHRGYKEEKRQGLKRVDFLMGYTRFQGISPTARGSDVWQLNIS